MFQDPEIYVEQMALSVITFEYGTTTRDRALFVFELGTDDEKRAYLQPD